MGNTYIGRPGASKNGGLESENWRMEDEEDADLARQGLFITDEGSTLDSQKKASPESECDSECIVIPIEEVFEALLKSKKFLKKMKKAGIPEGATMGIGYVSDKLVFKIARKLAKKHAKAFAELADPEGENVKSTPAQKEKPFARLPTDSEIEQRRREALRKQTEELQERKDAHDAETLGMRKRIRRLEEELRKAQVELTIRAVGSPPEPKIEPKKPGTPYT